ncbi:MAG: glycosyl hydrolase, partial [Planctomycetes bacterium]|nr:glycosyl hydrolase [Planctomycetota bacterium]
MKRDITILVLGLLVIGCSVKSERQPFSTEGRKVLVYTTASDTELRMALTDKKSFEPAEQPLESEVSVFVNPNKTFQTFWGIGAAITDASAEVFAKLPESEQEEFLKAYYDKDQGIGYTLARTPIHSCDFSSGSFTYVSDEDKELKTFNIDHDKQYRIPLIKKAIQATGGKL